jgi:uncharacterized membrane protein YecN with MAPEG domain
MVKKKTKMLSTMFVALSVALLFSMSMSVVHATRSVQVTWTSTATGLSVQGGSIAGKSDNRFLDLSLTAMCAGDIVGSYTSDSNWIIQNWITGVPLLLQPGPVYVHAIDYFSVTFEDKSGTLAILVNHVYYPSLGSSEGTWVIISGTDALANLHGQGTTLDPPGPGPTTWIGQVHFDP